MSNMGPKAATKEVNYVTLHEEVRLKNEEAQLEAVIMDVLAKSGIPTRSDFDALSRKIDELSAKIARS